MRLKLVVIGAGFSCPLGVPGMENILKEFRKLEWHKTHNWSINGVSITEQRAAKDTLDEWEKENPNVEAYGKRLVENSKHAGAFALNRFCRVFVRGLESTMERQDELERIKLWRELYLKFAKEIADHPEIVLCTFNQDLLLDQAFMANGYCPNYHLGDTDVLYVHECKGRAVTLLKPNGSINWLVCDVPFCDCKKITVKWEPPDTCLPRFVSGPERHLGHGTNPEFESELHFLMVPPGMKDRPEEWRHLVQLENVYDRLNHAISNVDDIFFVGWSAPDTDLALAKKTFAKASAQFHVVNYDDSQKLRERYDYLFDSRPFADFLGPNRGNIKDYFVSDWRKVLLQ